MMIEKSRQDNSVGLLATRVAIDNSVRLGALSAKLFLAMALALSGVNAIAQQSTSVGSRAVQGGYPEEYKDRNVGESEFDNRGSAYVKDWREAMPVDDYEDTEFGELLYNEASTPTKLEMLRLLSKDTPSVLVFMTAISMGLDIESVLRASVNFQPNKSRDLAGSAVSVLPLLDGSGGYLYSAYQLDDLEREDEQKPYSVADVVENFFENRSVLRPYPDWFEGQYHFLASAAELKSLQDPQKTNRWYRTKSNKKINRRPIFVSLYEHDKSVLIDGEDRIEEALKQDPNALLPVVFVFNRLNERAIDQLEYPLTIKGVQDAYSEKEIMVTPSPEWQLGDYHMYAKIDEFYDIFDLPEEEDFEPEAWQRLLSEAEDYSVANTSFIFVVLGGSDGANESTATAKRSAKVGQQLYAAWDDPRTEEAFPYVTPKDGPAMTVENIVSRGLIFNRPDLLVALNALGVKEVPISFYYLNSTRTKAFTKTPRALLQSVIGVDVPGGTFGGGGITPPPPAPPVCASPPCNQ